MNLKKNLIDKFIQQQKNNVIELLGETFPQTVPEQSSTIDNEILRVKNIFKIDTALPPEPSLYSPIHPDRDIVKAK